MSTKIPFPDYINMELFTSFGKRRKKYDGSIHLSWAEMFVDHFCPAAGMTAESIFGYIIPDTRPSEENRLRYMNAPINEKNMPDYKDSPFWGDNVLYILRRYHKKSRYRDLLPDIQDTNDFRVMTQETAAALLMAAKQLCWERYKERFIDEYLIKAAEERKKILQQHGIVIGGAGNSGSPSIEGAYGYLERTIEEAAHTNVLNLREHQGTLALNIAIND